MIKQTNGTYAIVPSTPAGIVTGEQLAKIAELVKAGAGVAKFTTGQRIAILTTQDKIKQVEQELAGAGLKPGPLGETVRNVKGCAGVLCKYHNRDAMKDALELDKVFAGRAMPASLKIAVSGCPKNCMEALSNDIGFIAMPDGYDVYVGGRGGRNQALGQLLCKNVQSGDLVELVEKIINKYTEIGKKRERISRVLELRGLETFQGILE